VEAVEEKGADEGNSQSVLVRVRPTDNPTTDNDEVAHFFSNDATSNFLVVREGKLVRAAVRGRNEVPNTTTRSVIDKTRNALVGSGAIAGFSSPQWSRLVNAILGK